MPFTVDMAMPIKRADVSFCAADDFELSVHIEVGENCFLDILYLANGNLRPRIAGSGRNWIQLHAYHAPLFPARNDIRESVAVEIAELHAIRAPRGRIDSVTPPRNAGNEDDFQ